MGGVADGTRRAGRSSSARFSTSCRGSIWGRQSIFSEFSASDGATGLQSGACILLIGTDDRGNMHWFLIFETSIVKVYTCSDHFFSQAVKVEQLWSQDGAIATLLSSGDIRHTEFVLDNDVIDITRIPLAT